MPTNGLATWVAPAVLGFDTETTGVDVTRDRIVTVALVSRSADGDTVHNWLISPDVEIPPAATAVHGISTEYAREHGAPAAEVLAEVSEVIYTALASGTPVVAFNAGFDLAILDAELARNGLPTLTDRLPHGVQPVVDPLVLDRATDRYRKGKRTLEDLCAVYGVVAQGSLHSADTDVTATLDVLNAILAVNPEVADMPLEELHEFQIKAHRTWAESFNQWRQSRGLSGPGANLSWPF